jgi:hypothetical protein
MMEAPFWIEIIAGIISSVVAGVIGIYLERYLHGKAGGKRKRAGAGSRDRTGPPGKAKAFLFSFSYMSLYVSILILVDVRWAISATQGFWLFFAFVILSFLLILVKNAFAAWIEGRDERGRLDNGGEGDAEGGMPARATLRKEPVEKPLVDFLPFLVLLLGLFFTDSVVPHDVSILHESQGKSTEIIAGRVTDPEWTVFVLIQPVGSSGIFSHKAVIGGDGEWNAICYFGGGAGSKFLVWAVAFNPNAMLLLGDDAAGDLLNKTATIRSRALLMHL